MARRDRESTRPSAQRAVRARSGRTVFVTLIDNPDDGFYWSAEHHTIVLDATMDEANMLVQLARALRLIFGRDDPTAP